MDWHQSQIIRLNRLSEKGTVGVTFLRIFSSTQNSCAVGPNLCCVERQKRSFKYLQVKNKLLQNYLSRKLTYSITYLIEAVAQLVEQVSFYITHKINSGETNLKGETYCLLWSIKAYFCTFNARVVGSNPTCLTIKVKTNLLLIGLTVRIRL